MNRFGSHPNHENRTIYEAAPPQGISEAQRAGSFLHFSHRSAAQEAPLGAVAYIVTNVQRGNNFHIISEYYDFHRNSLVRTRSLYSLLTWFFPRIVKGDTREAGFEPPGVLPVDDFSRAGRIPVFKTALRSAVSDQYF